MKNLARVVASIPRVAEKPGQSYEEMATLYNQAVGQWGRYMNHVAAVVGGAYTQERYGTGERFRPVEKSRQRTAVRYLNEAAFQVPDMFLNASMLRRIENEGAVDRFRARQASVVNALLSEDRLNRLVEFEALADKPSDVYTLADLMTDLRAGIWGELGESPVRISVYRRNLQRSFLAAADTRLNPSDEALTRANNPAPNPASSDVRGVLRAELQDIDRLVQQALPKAGDPMTRIHLRDLRTEIERILKP
jgi:hypothetical protein